jgi:hypothetical protein
MATANLRPQVSLYAFIPGVSTGESKGNVVATLCDARHDTDRQTTKQGTKTRDRTYDKRIKIGIEKFIKT